MKSNKIIVVDSIMGSGKTSWAIQYMNNNPNKKFIYITPYLSEIERIKNLCKTRKFYEPINTGCGKLDNFNSLILKEKNIVSTHSLFRMITDETRNLIKSNDYILILDEVMDVLEQVVLKKNDVSSMKTLNLIDITEKGLISWNKDKDNYAGRYDDIKLMCKNNSLFIVNNTIFMWTFPVDIFDYFSEVYILTYLFEGQLQKYYYDLYNVDCEYKSVTQTDLGFKLCDYISQYNMADIRSKINILNDDKLNFIGDSEFAMSKTWYEKNSILTKQLQKNLYNYFRNKLGSKSSDNLWTVFKKYKSALSGKGYSKGFLSLGSRATNLYIDKVSLAYCSNIFINTMKKQFFYSHNIEVNQDLYALSELIQWIWRSGIRNNKKINIYIPSKRMRNLLQNWLENDV